jgi:hypothetical protein
MKAFAGLLLVSVLASSLRGQDTIKVADDSTVHQATPLFRNPKCALILGSVIPGAGHIYSGEYWQGFWHYESTVGMIGGGVLLFYFDKCALNFLDTTCKSGPRWPYQVLGVASVAMGIREWISSARDAPHVAERANAKQLRRRSTATPIIESPLDSHSGWRIGAEVSF